MLNMGFLSNFFTILKRYSDFHNIISVMVPALVTILNVYTPKSNIDPDILLELTFELLTLKFNYEEKIFL